MDKELVDSFTYESFIILKELSVIIDKLEDEEHTTYPANLMAEFSQKIDRIMGAAQTLEMATGEHIGLRAIGSIAGNGKKLGQQAAALGKMEFIPVIAAFWGDTLDVLAELIPILDDLKQSREVVEKSFRLLQKRLDWLTTQFSRYITPEELDKTLKKLGLR